jgi:hypothetical protein
MPLKHHAETSMCTVPWMQITPILVLIRCKDIPIHIALALVPITCKEIPMEGKDGMCIRTRTPSGPSPYQSSPTTHGMFGWSQQTHASLLPSALRRGEE